MTVEQIAELCHETNRTYCRLNGDDSQPPWADAPDWQKASAIEGVLLHLRTPYCDDNVSHESWMAQKIAEGWVYGETKDPVAKTHPCIVPFDKLPPMQQVKDTLFGRVVDSARRLLTV